MQTKNIVSNWKNSIQFNSISNFPVMMVWTFRIIYSKRKLNDILLLTLHISEFTTFCMALVYYRINDANLLHFINASYLKYNQWNQCSINYYGTEASPWDIYWRGNERCANFVNEFTPFKINLMNQQTDWKLVITFQQI